MQAIKVYHDKVLIKYNAIDPIDSDYAAGTRATPGDIAAITAGAPGVGDVMRFGIDLTMVSQAANGVLQDELNAALTKALNPPGHK